MDVVLALVFGSACIGLLARMRRSRDVVDVQMGVVAAFSIGYFCLPVWFKSLSPISQYDEGIIAQSLLIFVLFLAMVVLGTWIGRSVLPAERLAMKTPSIDAFVESNRTQLTILAFVVYLLYYTTQELTSYSSSDFEGYFDNRGSTFAVYALVANLALAWIALSVASAYRLGNRSQLAMSGLMFLTIVVLLLAVGQRLAFLTPIVMLLAVFAVTGQQRVAIRVLMVGVLALLAVSPLAVAIREAPDDVDAITAIRKFDYGTNPVETVFQSIIDRGDLLYVSIRMKPLLDSDPRPSVTYYESVLVNPVPSGLLPGAKPFLLSTTGSPQGELSIYAWRVVNGDSTGSLTAFGGLVAYREGGWAGVLLNGLASGILFVAIARWLGEGGDPAKAVFASLFVSFAVKKVPPSFWEAISTIVPMLPILVLIILVEKSLRRARVRAA